MGRGGGGGFRGREMNRGGGGDGGGQRGRGNTSWAMPRSEQKIPHVLDSKPEDLN
jgi:hypothetical protein